MFNPREKIGYINILYSVDRALEDLPVFNRMQILNSFSIHGKPKKPFKYKNQYLLSMKNSFLESSNTKMLNWKKSDIFMMRPRCGAVSMSMLEQMRFFYINFVLGEKNPLFII